MSSDARKRAEEALVIAASRLNDGEACHVLETALRAILAEPAPAADAHAEEVRRLREALAPFCDPASYTTDEQECRRNPAMDWCAVHSFRWPCPVEPARAALAAAEKGGDRE